MIEKLKNLKYISLKEYQQLDKIEILYIDGVDGRDVFRKTGSCGIYEVSDINDIPKHVESLFVTKMKSLQVEEVSSFDKGFELLDVTRKKRTSKNKFILAPLGSDLKEENVIETEYLTNEIYFGYKVDVDEPGLVLLTNENALKDKNDIQFGIFDIGFFPNKMYYKLNCGEKD